MVKRVLVFLSMMILATGCFQQASESFETIESQDVSAPTTDPSGVTILDPNVTTPTGETLVTDMELTATAIMSAPTNTLAPIESVLPTTPAPNATATILIIEPPSSNTTPTQIGDSPAGNNSLVPTATTISVVTPLVDSQIDLPTATATPIGGSSDTNTTTDPNGLGATPTAIEGLGDASCIYVIQSGDTLFRIALNDDRFTLAELLAVNEITENEFIQPDQELIIPNCVPDTTGVVQPPTASATTVSAPAGSSIHVVSSGETLSVIAQRYGVATADIVAANNLTNPDALSIGQELIIPGQ